MYGLVALLSMGATGLLVLTSIIIDWYTRTWSIPVDEMDKWNLASSSLERAYYFTGIVALTFGFFHVHDE